MKRIKIFHIITSLLQDGAQHMLLRVLTNLDPEQFDLRVINLRGETPLVAEFEKRGIPVLSVDMKNDLGTWSRLLAMRRAVIAEQPDILQGWMEHGNLCASWIARGCKTRPAVYWNIRRSLYNLKHDKLNTKIVLYLCKWISRSVDGIIFCAKEAMRHYREFGFNLERALWIPNGFDIERFRKDTAAARYLTDLLGLPEGTVVVGNIGRYHPNKDHERYLRAAAMVIARRPSVHFVGIGRGINEQNTTLMNLAKELGIEKNIHLIGTRTDLPQVMPGFSIFCLASRTEGFPNVVGEAMCCEVPCVVTDSGATKELVEGVGTIVPRENTEKLVEALLHAIERDTFESEQEGARARERIRDLYTIQAVIASYDQLYKSSNTSSKVA